MDDLALMSMLMSEMSIKVDDYLANGGEFHNPSLCAGEWCVIHNPSHHHMRTWPRLLRSSTLIERICPHSVGHPDPDSLAYFDRKYPGRMMGVHGCCGCCRPPRCASQAGGNVPALCDLGEGHVGSHQAGSLRW